MEMSLQGEWGVEMMDTKWKLELFKDLFTFRLAVVKHTHLCSQYGRGRRIYDLAVGLVYINQPRKAAQKT